MQNISQYIIPKHFKHSINKKITYNFLEYNKTNNIVSTKKDKEYFALLPGIITNSNNLLPNTYYTVGTLISGRTPSKTSAQFGGADCTTGSFPTNIYIPTPIYSNPQSVVNAGITTNGFYLYRTGSMTSPVFLYTVFNMVDNKHWCLVFSSPYGSTATVNEIGKNIPFTGFLIQQQGGTNRSYSYFSSQQLFNTRSDTTLTTGGNKPGFRVYIGQAGGHGFYNTSQLVCNWPNNNGAVGAGWSNVTYTGCGNFPNNIRWGIGTSTTSAAYSLATNTTWETWITW